MATARTADRRTANRPLKSPLAVPSGSDTREHRLTPFSAIAFLASRTIPPLVRRSRGNLLLSAAPSCCA
jgi:hypothetical protein